MARDRALGRVVRNQRVQIEQHSGAYQRAANEKKAYKRKRMRPEQRQHLYGQPDNNEYPGPADTPLDRCSYHFPFAFGVQKVASFNVPTS